MFMFDARNFHSTHIMVRKTGAENRRQKMDSIYGAGFWSVCIGYEHLIKLIRPAAVRSATASNSAMT